MQGYPAVNGAVNTNTAPSALQISTGTTNPPKETSNVQLALNLNSAFALPVTVPSQQTGTGILPSAVLTTGSVIAFTDGTNPFTYTTLAGDTLASVATNIGASPNFTAGIFGNSLVIASKNGNPVTFTTNTLTDAAAETETLAATGRPQPPERSVLRSRCTIRLVPRTC